MSDSAEPIVATGEDRLLLSAAIVSSYVAHNPVSIEALPLLISEVHTAIKGLATESAAPAVPDLTPAIAIRKSVTPDYIVCLEDGKKLKALKRHLRASYNMTPEQYRMKWNLPSNYPMVAPNYSALRSRLAKNNGLGQRA